MPTPVVEERNFRPTSYLRATPLNEQEARNKRCACGQWYFYSATCRGVYQVYPYKCGKSRTRRGVNTSYCRGKSQRVLIANVYVNADCPSTHPHPNAQGHH